MPAIILDQWELGEVRIRAQAPDPHAGKRGHDYIAARQLNQPVKRLDKDAADRAERIRNLVSNWRPA